MRRHHEARELVADFPRYEAVCVALRQLNHLQQCCSIILPFLVLIVSTHGVPVGGFSLGVARDLLANPVSRVALLHLVVAGGTLAELLMWLGHMWLPRPGRELPFWSLVPLLLPSRALNKASKKCPVAFWSCHAALTSLLIALLAATTYVAAKQALYPDDPGDAAVMLGHCTIASTALLVFVASLDAWRVLYSTYWIASLASLSVFQLSATSCSPEKLTAHTQHCVASVRALDVALAIVFGTLYMWSGLFKVLSEKFQRHIAREVFTHLFTLVFQLHILVGKLCPRAPMEWLISTGSVVVEAFMGIALLLVIVCGPALEQNDLVWLASFAVLSFNALMHCTIIFCVGWSNGIQTFCSWNAMCMAVVALILAPHLLDGGRADFLQREQHFLDCFTGSSGCWLLLLIAAFNFFPVLQLCGRNEFPTLSHSWFVPESVQRSTLLFSKHAAYWNIPKKENGHEIVLFTDHSIPRAAGLLGGCAGDDPIMLKPHQLHCQPLEASGKLISGFLRLFEILDIELLPILKSQAQEAMSLAERRAVLRQLSETADTKVVCQGADWVNLCFSYYGGKSLLADPCREPFGAGPLGFWRVIVAEVVGAPSLRLVEGSGPLLRGTSKRLDLMNAEGFCLKAE